MNTQSPISYTLEQFNEQLASGPYAWPGGYPVYFVTSDGAALSFAAAKKEAELIRASIAEKSNDGWQVVGADINWEDPQLYCEHTGQRIESAYAEGEANE